MFIYTIKKLLHLFSPLCNDRILMEYFVICTKIPSV